MAGHRFHYSKAEKLLNPKRRELIAPEDVVSLLHINEHDIVADLGAGNGYFTVPIAKKAKTVYAVDVQQEMLDLLKQHAEKEGGENISYILSDVTATTISAQSVDKGLMAFVLHEVDDRKAVLTEVARIMKPSGTFILIEWEAVESEMGPPIHERIPSQQLMDEAKATFAHVEPVHFHPSVYGIVVKK
ncbi:SAM-dependent methyltransferase [Anoxybacillus flavithermus NBRC 109594]|uniref:SAM-dependent methyltransferase n=1 Tax=Anoxybacillus flavithermus NBRC 109594 TaxID=1315967 RepID=R4G196_9BACL|nr:methyltransferase domain-containing protein [Anoxybacillus flavithermus]GAC91329.1 SAM-dependent methyltransferase [Anoxybacillus flavithermus NBRC 109594]